MTESENQKEAARQIKQQFSKYLGFSSIEELRPIVEKGVMYLGNPIVVDSAEATKAIVGDDYVHSISHISRLPYVKERLRTIGKLHADSHLVSILMQEVYGVETGANRQAAFKMMFDMLRKPEDIEIPEAGKINKREEKEMEEIQKGLGKNFDKIYESLAFDGNVHIEYPKEIEEIFRCVQDTYRNRFGEPERVGSYHCLIPERIVGFCRGVVREETGVEPPKTKILVDTVNNGPSIHEGDIAIPKACLGNDATSISALLCEMPHFVVKAESPRPEEFGKDSKEFFKKMAWVEGVPEVVRERGLIKAAEERGTVNASEKVANVLKEGYNKQGVMFSHVSDSFIKFIGLDNTIGYATYYSIAYPVGWHFIRKLDKPTFTSLVQDTQAYKSPVFGWNRRISGEDRTNIANLLVNFKLSTRKKYEKEYKPEVIKSALKHIERWERDFLS